MFTDTISTGTIAVVYTRRGSSNTSRILRVPVGDTPANERRMEIAHEVTAAKRVNSMVKFGLTIIDAVTGKTDTADFTCKLSRTANITEAQVQLIVDHLVKFAGVPANVTKIYNQEA